jgi:CRP-like cAMP-binding protein
MTVRRVTIGSAHMMIPVTDLLVHGSNLLLLLISYSVRDILWLRWFAVAASLTVIPYYLLQPSVLWPPIFWGAVFTAINLFQIARIYIERRPVVFSEDERRLYALGFGSLRPREFISLVLSGEWRDAAPGEQPLTEGRAVTAVCIAIDGTVEVKRQDQHLAMLTPGHVIGNALALTGSPSPVTALFVGPGRYIRWPVVDLRTFLDRRPDLREALQKLISHDLAHKIEALVPVSSRPMSS